MIVMRSWLGILVMASAALRMNGFVDRCDEVCGSRSNVALFPKGLPRVAGGLRKLSGFRRRFFWMICRPFSPNVSAYLGKVGVSLVFATFDDLSFDLC